MSLLMSTTTVLLPGVADHRDHVGWRKGASCTVHVCTGTAHFTAANFSSNLRHDVGLFYVLIYYDESQ